MGNLNYRMEVPNDQYSPHLEEIDITSTNSISRELEDVCSTMYGAFVYKGYTMEVLQYLNILKDVIYGDLDTIGTLDGQLIKLEHHLKTIEE